MLSLILFIKYEMVNRPIKLLPNLRGDRKKENYDTALLGCEKNEHKRENIHTVL